MCHLKGSNVVQPLGGFHCGSLGAICPFGEMGGVSSDCKREKSHHHTWIHEVNTFLLHLCGFIDHTNNISEEFNTEMNHCTTANGNAVTNNK